MAESLTGGQKKTAATSISSSIANIMAFQGDQAQRRHTRDATLKQLDFIQAASHSAGSFSGIEANKPIEHIKDLRLAIKKQGKAENKAASSELAGQLLTAALVVGVALI